MADCVAFLCVFAFWLGLTSGFSCKSGAGDDLPWFTAYKLPELKNETIPIEKGEALLFLDQSHSDWTSSGVDVDGKGHHVEKTLAQLYDDITEEISSHSSRNENLRYKMADAAFRGVLAPYVKHFKLLYNDEHPGGNWSETSGHTKGVVLFGETTGFWLIHSVPKFPPTDAYAYPSSGHRYGQSFLCISFSTDQLQSIAKQLLFLESYIYQSVLSRKMAEKFPELVHVVKKEMVNVAPFSRIANLAGVDGSQYTHFSKAGKWGKDLYSNFVAPTFKVPLEVESWRNGGGNLPPACAGSFKTFDVHRLNFTTPVPLWFWNFHDHSKWAVSRDARKPWICIGDINRQEHQLARGGGTMCQKNQNLWKQYHNLVTLTDNCNRD